MIGKNISISIEKESKLTVADIPKILASIKGSLLEHIELGGDKKWMTESLEELN